MVESKENNSYRSREKETEFVENEPVILSYGEALNAVSEFAAKQSLLLQKEISAHQGLEKRMGQLGSKSLKDIAYYFHPNNNPKGVEKLIRTYKSSVIEMKPEKDQAQRELDTMHSNLANEIGEKIEENKFEDVEKWVEKSLSDMLSMYTESDRRNRMTQLYTKRELLRRAAEALSQAEKNKGSLVFYNVDADMFKAWNDAFGHTVGDLVLQNIALEMHEFTEEQKNGIASRVGGEELTGMIVVPNGESFDSRSLELFQESVGQRLSSLIDKIQKEVGDSFDVREKLMETLFKVRKNEVDTVISEHQNFKNWLECARKICDSLVYVNDPSTAYEKISCKIEELDNMDDLSIISQLQEMQKELSLMLPLGTVTVGAIQVEFSGENHVISNKDIQAINSRINSKDTKQTISHKEIREVFSGDEIEIISLGSEGLVEIKNSSLTYVDFEERINVRLKKISGEIRNLNLTLAECAVNDKMDIQKKLGTAVSEKVAWESLLNQVKHARVGRMIEQADTTQEMQKKKKRNSVAINEPISIKDSDNGKFKTKDEKESKYVAFHAEVQRCTRKYDQKLRVKLEGMISKTIEEIKKSDPRMKRWKRLVRFLKNSFENNKAYDKELTFGKDNNTVNVKDYIKNLIGTKEQEVLASFDDNLSEKYLDSLLRSPNDTYEEEILPAIVSQAYRKKSAEQKGEPDDKEKDHGSEEDEKVNFCVVSFDFDNLKAVNEVAGHAFGDTVLRLAAVEFKTMALANPGVQFIRPSGGEEFILVVPDKTANETATLVKETAKKISDKVKELLESTTVDDTSVYERVKDYMETELDYKGEDLEKIGTITAAVVDIADNNKEMSSAELVRYADELGEYMKKENMRGITATEKYLLEKKQE